MDVQLKTKGQYMSFCLTVLVTYISCIANLAFCLVNVAQLGKIEMGVNC